MNFTYTDFLSGLCLEEGILWHIRHNVQTNSLFLHHTLYPVVFRIHSIRKWRRADVRVMLVRLYMRIKVRGNVVARFLPDLSIDVEER